MNRSTRRTVIGHRGASADFPENTHAAFEAALAAGADGIELDLQLSRDGVPVVFHDATLVAVGRGDARVRDLTRDELRAVDVGDSRIGSASMPTLDEVLDRFAARTTLLLAIKARPPERRRGDHLRLAEIVTDRLAAIGALDRAYVLSFDSSCLARARARHRAVRTVLNTGRPSGLSADALTPLHALSVDVNRLSPATAALARAAAVPLMTYTVNDDAACARAIAADAAVLMTDRPAWLLAALRTDSQDAAR